MAKAGSVAPKERINIKFVPATGDQQAEVELPLKLMVFGDFQGREDETPIEEREIISIDKSNFEDVMEKNDLSVQATVKNRLVEDDDQDLSINLSFKSMRDFTPDAIAQQVPELKKLVELREALVALKGPLGNIPAFRSKLQNLLADEESRNKLLGELNIITHDDKE